MRKIDPLSMVQDYRMIKSHLCLYSYALCLPLLIPAIFQLASNPFVIAFFYWRIFMAEL